MDQRRSRRALIGVLALGAALLATPFLWKTWTESHELDGKVPVFDVRTSRPANDLLGCLVHRPEGGLKLRIVTENNFADPQRGIVVRIQPQAGETRVQAWIATGGALTAGETAQLQGCAAA